MRVADRRWREPPILPGDDQDHHRHAATFPRGKSRPQQENQRERTQPDAHPARCRTSLSNALGPSPTQHVKTAQCPRVARPPAARRQPASRLGDLHELEGKAWTSCSTWAPCASELWAVANEQDDGRHRRPPRAGRSARPSSARSGAPARTTTRRLRRRGRRPSAGARAAAECHARAQPLARKGPALHNPTVDERHSGEGASQSAPGASAIGHQSISCGQMRRDRAKRSG